MQAACSTSLPPCTRRVGALTTNPPLLNKVWFHAEVRDLLKVRLPGCKTATLEWKYPRYTAHSTVTGGQRMLKIPATHGGVRLCHVEGLPRSWTVRDTGWLQARSLSTVLVCLLVLDAFCGLRLSLLVSRPPVLSGLLPV